MEKLLQSFKWAKNGLLTVLKEEDNFQIEIIISIAVCVLGLIIHLSRTEWLFIFIAICIVLCAEMVNTAVEDLCNKIEPNQNKEIGKIKDIMAGFTLTACICSGVIGLIIFLPYFL